MNYYEWREKRAKMLFTQALYKFSREFEILSILREKKREQDMTRQEETEKGEKYFVECDDVNVLMGNQFILVLSANEFFFLLCENIIFFDRLRWKISIDSEVKKWFGNDKLVLRLLLFINFQCGTS